MTYTGSKAAAGIGTQLQSCATTNGTWATPSTVDEVLEVKPSGSGINEIDVSNMDTANLAAPYEEFVVGLLKAGTVEFECNGVPTSTTQTLLNTDYQGRVLRDYIILFPNGTSNFKFRAYVTKFDPTFPVKEQIKYSFSLKISGARSYNP